MIQPPNTINVGRKKSGGVFNGLFGNPVYEKHVSEQYRTHIRKVIADHPVEAKWLKQQLRFGCQLFCPGCGVGSPTCHARILEEEILEKTLVDNPFRDDMPDDDLRK